MAEYIEVPTKYVDGIEVKNGSELKQLHSGDLRATFDEMKIFETDSTTSVEFWLGGELVCSYFIKPHLARRFEVAWSHESDYICD
jgi:hypothetical protein